MRFDIGWALFGAFFAIAFYIVDWKIAKVQIKLSELILNYNAMLKLLRKHQPDIFGETKLDEVSESPASSGIPTGNS